jgi:hypothetical protein
MFCRPARRMSMLKPTVHQSAATAIVGIAVLSLKRNGIGPRPKNPSTLFVNPDASLANTARKISPTTAVDRTAGR